MIAVSVSENNMVFEQDLFPVLTCTICPINCESVCRDVAATSRSTNSLDGCEAGPFDSGRGMTLFKAESSLSLQLVRPSINTIGVCFVGS